MCRNYRNRRIGDFLKELDMTEGRSTGFPKIYRELRKNGSPMPEFETDGNNTFFLATIHIHPEFLKEDVGDDAVNDTVNGADVPAIVPAIVPVNVPVNVSHKPDDIDWEIVEAIIADKYVTRSVLAERLGKTVKTIQRHMKKLQEQGIIRREGSDKTGCWVVISRNS